VLIAGDPEGDVVDLPAVDPDQGVDVRIYNIAQPDLFV
jgi:hypothetical protein